MRDNVKAYLIGGGIASLAAAAFLVRDGKLAGRNVTIFDAAAAPGGSLDATESALGAYSMRGGRMLTTDNYECTWDLFKSIPSITHPDKSVYQETVDFNRIEKSAAKARLVDRRRAKVAVRSMGFSMQDRLELLHLINAEEADLEQACITDQLSPEFFETEFWLLWSTTFAFQPWHSAVEFRRYLHRFMLEFSRIETLAGVKRTVLNQFEAMVLPLQHWLEGQGVRFLNDTTVTALDHDTQAFEFSVTGIQTIQAGSVVHIAVDEGDLVFLQNGSMTDASSLGSMSDAPAKLTKADAISWRLWETLAEGRQQFGQPGVFNSCIAQSCWESFTVTLMTPEFFNRMERFSGNRAGTGGLVTFKDSRWLMSIVLPHQPHFAGQPADVQVFWGYALFPDRVGDFVPKAMEDCNGAEILRELCGHLHFDPQTVDKAICIPCRMPYITSMFMPRELGDRPPPVPLDSKCFAFLSQFVEIPQDVVFTVEYSVRVAQMAVYELLKIDRQIPPVTPHDKSLRVQVDALLKALK